MQASFLSPLLAQAASRWALRNTRTGIVLATTLETAFDRTSRRRGLLGREGLPGGYALVLAPCLGIHTFGMRFPIDVVFAAASGLVLKVCRQMPPRRFAIVPRAHTAIELAAGSVGYASATPGDHLELLKLDSPSEVWTAPELSRAADRRLATASH